MMNLDDQLPRHVWFTETVSPGITWMRILDFDNGESRRSKVFRRPFNDKVVAFREAVFLNRMLGWTDRDAVHVTERFAR